MCLPEVERYLQNQAMYKQIQREKEEDPEDEEEYVVNIDIPDEYRVTYKQYQTVAQIREMFLSRFLEPTFNPFAALERAGKLPQPEESRPQSDSSRSKDIHLNGSQQADTSVILTFAPRKASTEEKRFERFVKGRVKERMSDNPSNAHLQLNRLKLRNSVYSKLSTRYRDERNSDNQMVRHFYNRGEDAPIWVIFEILYLSDLASFFECLNTATRESILNQLKMFDISIDTNRELLSIMLYTLKALRNAVAHNNIIFDTRFKDRKISLVLKKWVEKETGIQNITLYSLIDYIIIICCILKRIDFSGTRALELLHTYKEQNIQLQASVASSIYNQIIPQNVTSKITALEAYLNT